jgi:hypothetical protein
MKYSYSLPLQITINSAKCGQSRGTYNNKNAGKVNTFSLMVLAALEPLYNGKMYVYTAYRTISFLIWQAIRRPRYTGRILQSTVQVCMCPTLGRQQTCVHTLQNPTCKSNNLQKHEMSTMYILSLCTVFFCIQLAWTLLNRIKVF